MAHSANGKWNSDSDSGYKYDAVDTSSLKSYEIVGQCEGKFGETEKVDVIAPVEGTGTKDRFYVMALEDLDNSTHHWYYAADGNLNNLVSADIINFTEDSGKKNTKDMLDIYGKTVENGGYGEPVPEESLYDLWAMTKLKDKNEEKMGGWFVPSRVEWSAFGDMLYTEKKITKSNYYHYLKGLYWSSSQYNNRLAWTANFSSPTYYMDHNYVRDWLHVRLSATF